MCELSIKLEGFPEKIQRIADAIEDAFPGLIAWTPSDEVAETATIRIEGVETAATPFGMPGRIAA